MPDPDARADADPVGPIMEEFEEFAAVLNAYTDGVASLALVMARHGVGAGTTDQKKTVTDGYRSLCREYAALVRKRDQMRPVVEAAVEWRVARSAHDRAMTADDITFARAKDRYFAAEEALIVSLIPLVRLDDLVAAATAPPDGEP